MESPRSASPLVSASWLAEHIDDPSLRIVDVRWYLDGRSGPAAYEAGHVPGAIHLDIDGQLAAPKGPGRPGRHPLPDADAFAETLARAGIGPDAHVVAYDDDGGAIAARLWWMLGYFGHPARVSVLDGGIQAWQEAGGALASGRVSPPPAERASLALQQGRKVDRDAVKALLGQGTVLLDARAPARYEGAIEPVDARAGHIPGAISAPYVENLQSPKGLFLSPEALRDRYAALGASDGRDVIVYCGSGVTACHDLLALALAGVEARLYEGSWSDWSSDLSLPIKTGKEP